MTAKLSDLDMEMVVTIPPGGNWKDIPLETVNKSKRLQQIRKSGGRTTYYGRLRYDQPSYTISTYFNRPGNGCYIHPEQDRLISLREGARLQSFPDSFRFSGSNASKYKQIGNAVPPLMARAVTSVIEGDTAIDLFAGAGGLSWGIHASGFKTLVTVDSNADMCESLERNNAAREVLNLDLTRPEAIEAVVERTESLLRGSQLDLCAGGPPCQGFSTAGNWDEMDPRNNLFKPFLAIVRSLEPANVLIENVLGIRSMRNGEVLRKIISLLEDMGYIVRERILKSEQFGVPQKRRRVFVYATLNDHPLPLPSLLFSSGGGQYRFTSEGDTMVLPPPVTVGDAISDLPPIVQGGGKEVMEYDTKWIASDYQRWLRGQIDTDSMFQEYRDKLS